MAHQHPIEKVKIDVKEIQSKFLRLEAEFARLRDRVEGPENANLEFLVSQLRMERERANSAEEELGLQRQRANAAEQELGLQRERANSADERLKSAEQELGLQRQRANSAEEELGLQRQRTNSAEEELGVQRRRANSAEQELGLQRQRANSAEEKLDLQRQWADSAEDHLRLERDRVKCLEEKLRSSERKLEELQKNVTSGEQLGAVQKRVLVDPKVNQRDREGRTQLYRAARDGDEVKVQRLLSQGADVNIGNNDGFTPLHIGAYRGHVNVCASLLNRDTTCLNARNKWKRTPLHLASIWGHMKVVKLLVKRGADTTARNEDGESAWDVACLMGGRKHKKEIRRLLR